MDSINITTTLLTPEYQQEYSVIKDELEQSFDSSNPARKSKNKKCNIALGIEKFKRYSGITSTAFSVNMTIDFTVSYTLHCDDNIKTNGVVALNGDLTLVQDKTIGEYIGEQQIIETNSRRAALMIYNEIKVFFVLNNNKKLDKSYLNNTI